MSKNNEKWSSEKLLYFEKLVRDKIDSAKEELESTKKRAEQMRDASQNNAIYSSHMADASGDHVELEQSYYMIARLEKFIKYLSKALQMIEDGTFGVCVITGELIPEERMLEVPNATKSVDAKEQEKLNL